VPEAPRRKLPLIEIYKLTMTNSLVALVILLSIVSSASSFVTTSRVKGSANLISSLKAKVDTSYLPPKDYSVLVPKRALKLSVQQPPALPKQAPVIVDPPAATPSVVVEAPPPVVAPLDVPEPVVVEIIQPPAVVTPDVAKIEIEIPESITIPEQQQLQPPPVDFLQQQQQQSIDAIEKHTAAVNTNINFNEHDTMIASMQQRYANWIDHVHDSPRDPGRVPTLFEYIRSGHYDAKDFGTLPQPDALQKFNVDAFLHMKVPQAVGWDHLQQEVQKLQFDFRHVVTEPLERIPFRQMQSSIADAVGSVVQNGKFSTAAYDALHVQELGSWYVGAMTLGIMGAVAAQGPDMSEATSSISTDPALSSMPDMSQASIITEPALSSTPDDMSEASLSTDPALSSTPDMIDASISTEPALSSPVLEKEATVIVTTNQEKMDQQVLELSEATAAIARELKVMNTKIAERDYEIAAMKSEFRVLTNTLSTQKIVEQSLQRQLEASDAMLGQKMNEFKTILKQKESVETSLRMEISELRGANADTPKVATPKAADRKQAGPKSAKAPKVATPDADDSRKAEPITAMKAASMQSPAVEKADVSIPYFAAADLANAKDVESKDGYKAKAVADDTAKSMATPNVDKDPTSSETTMASNQPKATSVKTVETKADDAKKVEPKVAVTKTVEMNAADAENVELKKEDAKKVEPKVSVTKTVGPNAADTENVELRKKDAKKVEPKAVVAKTAEPAVSLEKSEKPKAAAVKKVEPKAVAATKVDPEAFKVEEPEGDDWSSLSESTLSRKTVKELTSYLVERVSSLRHYFYL
jgi:hypothetical protein